MAKKEGMNKGLKITLIVVGIIMLLFILFGLYEPIFLIFFGAHNCGKDFLEQYNQALITGNTNICKQFEERGYLNFKGSAICLLNKSGSFTPQDCFNGIAYSTQDIKVCINRTFGVPIDADDDTYCLSKIKSLSEEPTKCEMLISGQDKTDVDNCYSFVAKKNLDVTRCAMIEDLTIQSFCIREITLLTQNISICEEQINPHIMYHCYGGLADKGFYEKEQPSDTTQQARDNITVDLCKQISKDDSLQDFCFMDVIIYHNDSTLCNNESIPQKRRVLEGCNYIGAIS